MEKNLEVVMEKITVLDRMEKVLQRMEVAVKEDPNGGDKGKLHTGETSSALEASTQKSTMADLQTLGHLKEDVE